MYKILFGIPSIILPEKYASTTDGYIRNYTVEDDMSMWCDFELDYYPEEDVYKFEFETMLGFNSDDGCRNWIIKCLSSLTDYMNEYGYDTSKEIDMYEAFTEGYNVKTRFDSIEEAYAWLKMMVFGFHGEGLKVEN